MMCRTTIGASSILGLISDNHLTSDEFNTLGSAFYIGELLWQLSFWKMTSDNCMKGYIVWAYPHSWALQRLPVGKYLAVNILLWAVFLGLQCLCTNFGGLCE